MLDMSSSFHPPDARIKISLQLRSMERTALAVFGLNHIKSGSSAERRILRARARLTTARAKGASDEASLLGKRRALATITMAGFKSKPTAGNPIRDATEVVVPLPFQGS
jgi:hypothetical protein